MYGDTQVIRKRAGELREQSVDLRALADRLVAQVDGLAWSGRAADALRARIHDRAAHLRATAHGHESAAEALGRHAAEVEVTKDAITEAQRTFESVRHEAQARVERLQAESHDGVRVEPTPADAALLAFTPPAPGHLDWVTTEIPGR